MDNSELNVTVQCVMCWTWVDKEDTEEGSALGTDGPFCSDCKSWLTDYEFTPLGEMQKKSLQLDWDEADYNAFDADPWNQAGTGLSINHDWKNGTYTKSWPVCHHHLFPYTLTQGKIYLSGYSALIAKTRRQGPIPTIGVYLSHDWLIDQVVSNNGFSTPTRPKVAYVGWPDFGIISVETLYKVAVWTAEQIELGANVEVGCYGGHGRTGTLVAAIDMLSGKSAKDAIADVRRLYCSKSIETIRQEHLLDDLETLLNA